MIIVIMIMIMIIMIILTITILILVGEIMLMIMIIIIIIILIITITNNLIITLGSIVSEDCHERSVFSQTPVCSQELLIAHGANVNQRDMSGNTPLLYTCHFWRPVEQKTHRILF